MKQCVVVLLQRAPADLSVEEITGKILALNGVISIFKKARILIFLGVHDFHVWELVDGLNICTVHVACARGTHNEVITSQIKGILHEHSVHSSTVQIEYTDKVTGCTQYCIKRCEEEW